MQEVNRGRWSIGPSLLGFYALLVYGFLFAPILIVIITSFNSARFSGFPLQSFTLQWYRDLIRDSTIWEAVRRSGIVALATTILATTLGLLAASALSRHTFRLKPAFTAILVMPLVIPGIIMGVSLVSFYSFFKINTSLFTVILGHTALALPYTTLVIAARMQGFDRRLEEAASGLGATYLPRVCKNHAPLSRPWHYRGSLVCLDDLFR